MSGRMKCAVSSLKKTWKKLRTRKKFTLTYKIYLNLQNNSHKKKYSCFRQFYNSNTSNTHLCARVNVKIEYVTNSNPL